MTVTRALNLVGYTAEGSLSADELDVLTGREARAVRVYHHSTPEHPVPVPTSAAKARILYHLQKGRQVVLSLKVLDDSADTMARCDALAADIASLGYAGMVWVVLWHEPYPELSPTQYVARYAAVAPAIRRHGVKCGVCFHTWPIWHKNLDYTTYWPGDSITDFLGIDTYPADAPNGAGFSADPLGTIAPLTSFAKQHDKPFLICEVGASTAQDPAGAAAWLKKFTRLGQSCRCFLYYNHRGLGLETNNDALVPAYQAVYDHFDSVRMKDEGQGQGGD